MKLLFVIANSKCKSALIGLIGACERKDQAFLCFFTGDGVTLLDDAELQTGLAGAERAVVCEFSWEQFAPDRQPPIEQGSQTDHSSMVGTASHVVSL